MLVLVLVVVAAVEELVDVDVGVVCRAFQSHFRAIFRLEVLSCLFRRYRAPNNILDGLRPSNLARRRPQAQE